MRYPCRMAQPPRPSREGDDWFAVVTDQNEILIYSKVTGNLRQRITIESE